MRGPVPNILARTDRETNAAFAQRIIDAAKHRGVTPDTVVSKAKANPGTLTSAEHQLLVAHYEVTKGLPK